MENRSSKHKSKKKNSNGILLLIIMIIIGIVFLLGKNAKNNNQTSSGKTQSGTTSSAADVEAPELALDSEKTVVAIGEKYRVKATATDNVDGDITSKITVSSIDTSKAGEQEVTISVSDSSGNKTEKKQKVIVREELSNGLPVLMYHFFYDNKTYTKRDNNWLNINDFEEQLKYMTENDFYFPTWDEVNDYIDGKIKLPSKSVVLTVDDGDASFFDLAVPLIQKYKVPTTSFVVTGWYGYRYDPNMKYVVWESHSCDMHESGANGKGRMVNWSYEQIVQDLKTSSETLGGAKIFCYPFGHYNDTAIKALKDSSYIMAFTVEGGRVTKNTDKFKLPRVRVGDGNSLSYFVKSIS